HASALLAALVPARPFSARVAAEICASLRHDDASLAAVAPRLAMSPRAVQRRLRAEGATFQQLLDEVRRDLPKRYIQDPAHSLSQIAFLLGFGDQTAFHRAFVRWTGVAPGRFRRGAHA